ncbi:glycerophosphodiester phosphodiesterase family protein, partial [Spirulina sp. 06S082]|uniref:glycerophosphodiester phosphodiesterase family protein n=1 Tax=Spirulina sp. 06S082 TaxID=3110248 RepID=UPI002B220E2D
MRRVAAVAVLLICGLATGQASGADPSRPATPPPTDFWQDQGFMNMAHQGGELEAPGNTLYAFKTAVRYRGADALEMDSFVSADGVLMVTHDMRPSGTSNAPNDSDHEVRDLTVDELKSYDFAWKFTPGKGHYGFNEADPHPYRGIATGGRPPPLGYSANDFTMATFEEVLEAFPDTPLNIDMKSNGSDPGVSLAAADALAAIMNAHPERSEDVIVASFDQAAMERFHELAPDHKALSGSLDATLGYVNGNALSPVPVAVQPPDLFNLGGTLVRTVPILKPLADYDGFAVHVWGSDSDPEQETDSF